MMFSLKKVVLLVALASTSVQASAFAPNAAVKSVTGSASLTAAKPLQYASQ